MDTMTITILDDGTIRTETDPVSQANHSNAEAFLRLVSELGGGKTERKRKHGHTHTHAHQHKEQT